MLREFPPKNHDQNPSYRRQGLKCGVISYIVLTAMGSKAEATLVANSSSRLC